jgi:hypothetical protein
MIRKILAIYRIILAIQENPRNIQENPSNIHEKVRQAGGLMYARNGVKGFEKCCKKISILQTQLFVNFAKLRPEPILWIPRLDV